MFEVSPEKKWSKTVIYSQNQFYVFLNLNIFNATFLTNRVNVYSKEPELQILEIAFILMEIFFIIHINLKLRSFEYLNNQ